MRKKPLTLSEFSRLGGIARQGKMTRRERIELATKAANVRWRNLANKPKHSS